MNLSYVANIATIIETICVVVSIFLILYELRKNNRLTRAANAQSLVELSSEFNLQLIQDRKMAALWQIGPNKFAEMDEIDKYRYKSLLVWWLILHENIYYQWQNGLLDDEMYRPWAHDLDDFVREKHLHVHWDSMKHTYQSDFSNEVSKIILNNNAEVS